MKHTWWNMLASILIGSFGWMCLTQRTTISGSGEEKIRDPLLKGLALFPCEYYPSGHTLTHSKVLAYS